MFSLPFCPSACEGEKGIKYGYYRARDGDYVRANIDELVKELSEILEKSSVDAGHGIDHACTVMNHCQNALKCESPLRKEGGLWNQCPCHKAATACRMCTLEVKVHDIIVVAGLLHDADDSKFFPEHKDNENTRHLLRHYPQEFRDSVVALIALVSCSKNRNTIPLHQISRPEPGVTYLGETAYRGLPIRWCDVELLLIPRWADRLESVGEIGVERAIIYTKIIDRPMHTPETAVVHTLDELYKVATDERFNNYKGVSVSVIDHMYDKVLHLKVHTGIKYLDDIFEVRHKVVEDFVLSYWNERGIGPHWNVPHRWVDEPQDEMM